MEGNARREMQKGVTSKDPSAEGNCKINDLLPDFNRKKVYGIYKCQKGSQEVNAFLKLL